MSSSAISPCGLTLYDVGTEISDKLISKAVKKHLPDVEPKIHRGAPYRKNTEDYQRVYIDLHSVAAADEFMQKRPFKLNGEPLRVTRSLPHTYRLYDRSVTGLKIHIQPADGNHSLSDEVNENDLKKYFQQYGIIRRCQWMDKAQTEALFQFDDFDAVDKSILYNPSLKIKGRRIALEKFRMDDDCIAKEHPYCVHVINLPVHVTCEELAAMFRAPVTHILVHPCFHIEQSHLTNGRRTSEAWIKGIPNRQAADALAHNNSNRILRTQKIRCEAMLEPIYEEELCIDFQKGQCTYGVATCHDKHISCDEPDTCDDPYCWYGHSNRRTTVSRERPAHRSENARYRIKLSNLPGAVTHDDLIKRLKLSSKSSHLLILQPVEEGDPDAPRMAYLIRQRAENHARQLINKWYDKSYSTDKLQRIHCQLEVNQEFFEWNDCIDETRSVYSSRCTSPSSSIQSTSVFNRTRPGQLYSSVASTVVLGQRTSRNLHTARAWHQSIHAVTNQPSALKVEPVTGSLESPSVIGFDQAPTDVCDSSSSWQWTDQVALERLRDSNCTPELLDSNVTSDSPPKKELWTTMKFSDDEGLSDCVKNNKLDLREALKITRQIVHRDIQPKHVLVEQREQSNEISVMLFNFTTAWIDDANGQLHSPTIDTSTVCAILFWLITGEEPKESRDICGKAPHQLPSNLTLIEKRMRDIADFHADRIVFDRLERHMTLLFDRGFAGPDQQWSVDELDCQCQFILALLNPENEHVSYFPTSTNTIEQPLLSFRAPVVFIASLVYHLKNHFAGRYCKCMRWSTSAQDRWLVQGEHIDHHDVLNFWHQESTLSINTHWSMKMLKDSQFSMRLRIRSPGKIVVELPLGISSIKAAARQFDALLKSFEMDMKVVIGLLLQSVSSSDS